jgi:hypothetical protein
LKFSSGLGLGRAGLGLGLGLVVCGLDYNTGVRPTSKIFGHFFLQNSPLIEFLKFIKEDEFLIESDREFQAKMADGKNDC